MNDLPIRCYRGIRSSLGEGADVVEMYVDAKEADEFFYWVGASEEPVEKLKQLFPNLRRLIIEDDYLIQSQITALVRQLPPIIVKWTAQFYLDGRHGR